MGVSTDALLFYGYAWEEDIELLSAATEGSDRDDWVELLAAQRGIVNPWDDFPHAAIRPVQQAWKIENRPAMEARWAAKKAIEAEYAVSIGYHGSASWQCPYVYVKDSQLRAARGYPKAILTDGLGEEWDAELTRFFTDTGISVRDAQGPGWFLASWWAE